MNNQNNARTTFIINVISGPGSGKTTICALIFAKLKISGYVTEYVQEYPKTLVWMKDYDTLNNQYFVSSKQVNLFKSMNTKVDFIVTDGSILHGLYYNRHNKHNTSNIEKTEKFIIDSYNEFHNINIFLDRGEFDYETDGRIQTETEAREIDVILMHMLKQNGIPFERFVSSPDSIDPIIKFILDSVD